MQSILSISTYDQQGKGMNYADLFLELSTVSSACARVKLRLFQNPLSARISDLPKLISSIIGLRSNFYFCKDLSFFGI